MLQWGFALEYSLPYLSSYVRDVGLPEFFRRMISLVEVELSTPLDRGQTGRTTGTVNPGIIWAGRFFQVGLEAVVPINERTGKNLGVRAMLYTSASFWDARVRAPSFTAYPLWVANYTNAAQPTVPQARTNRARTTWSIGLQ